jgi:hypothetical protein
LHISFNEILLNPSHSFFLIFILNLKNTGLNKTCPEQEPSKSGTLCDKYENGKCDGVGHCLSVCKQQNLASDSCFCKDTANQCVQCCTDPSSYSKCVPFHELFYPNQAIYYGNGRSCGAGRCENVSEWDFLIF